MSQSKQTNLYLLDSLNLIFRSVLTKGPDLRSPNGEPTKGPYFFTKMLLSILDNPAVTHLAIALDSSREKLERKQVFPAYKAQRKTNEEQDPVITEQIKICFEILNNLDLPLYRIPTHEADDVIGSLAQLSTTEIPSVIVSSDKDLHQLVSPTISIYSPIEDKWYREADVCSKWEIRFPKQVCDYKMLVGDTSDNYKGVENVGPVLAKKVLQEKDTAEEIVTYKGKISARAKEGIKNADFTVLRKLAEVRKELQIVKSVDDLQFSNWKIPDKAKVIFDRLGFKRWAN